MKIGVFSDTHLDATTAGFSRHEEIAETIGEIVLQAITMKLDLVVFLGDLCDPDSGSEVFRCVEVAIAAATLLQREGIPSVWVAGNHDVVESPGMPQTTLSPLRSLMSDSVKDVSIRVVEEPTKIEFPDLDLYFLPFTSTSRTYDPSTALVQLVGEKQLVAHQAIVFGHLNVKGVVPASETYDLPRGRDVWLPHAKIDEIAESMGGRLLVVNGHYHAGGEYRSKEHKTPTTIVGSPCRLTFGEEDNEPCWIVIDTGVKKTKKSPLKVDRIALPCRRVKTRTVDQVDAVEAGEIVRFRLDSEISDAEVAEIREQAIARGAVAVRMLRAQKAAVVVQDAGVGKEARRKARSVREVVAEIVEEANTKDREKLTRSVEESLAAVGL